MFKKNLVVWIFMSLTALLLLAACSNKQVFNQTGYPITAQPHILKVATIIPSSAPNPNEVKAWQMLEEQTNIKIDWIVATDTTWSQKKNLMFATGNLPDLFVGNWILNDQEILTYSQQGKLRETGDLIDKYSVYLKEDLLRKPEYKKLSTLTDGKMYSLPIYDDGEYVAKSQSVFFINKKWLDKLNLPVPTTTEEYYKVLKAFKENDLNGNGENDEIPFTNIGTPIDFFSSFGYINYDNHLCLRNNKIIYTPIQPENKEAIQWLNKLFKEGLFDGEAFIQNSNMFNAKLKSPIRKVGSFYGYRNSSWQLSKDDDEYIAIPPLKGPRGDQHIKGRIKGFRGVCGVAITTKCANPEIAMRWADELYNPYGKLQQYVESSNLEPDKYYVPSNAIYNSMSGKGIKYVNVPNYIKDKQKLDKIYEQYIGVDLVPEPIFNISELEQVKSIQSDASMYIRDKYAKWIMLGGVEDDWNNYIDRLKEMQVDKLVRIYQDAYDRYKE